jgi:serine/threonine protein kinase
VSDPVDDLAAEYTDRLRQGEDPCVDDYTARLPDRAEEVRAALEAVALMERHKPRSGIPDRLGEYRILREIGRGGMGIVYEADHEALGRRVAVKVLPGLANARARERFRRETLAAARLHHTNIVPVYGVGERDGQCYYVMQLITGRALDAIARAELGNAAGDTMPLEEAMGPSRSHGWSQQAMDAASVARIGAQVADALAHAHGQGVLHRDIKPSNLLLDEVGTVWVTDFGVAKLNEGADLTHSGDLVGTLRYMPPERFSGVSDPRGDIYSLGITLYELATGQPAFPDTTPQHLIQLITQENLPSPRMRNPALPADLETILLKATARDPAQRYESAADLADDLQRFLADRPVKARRIGPVGQMLRWCRRNPALALSLAAVLLLMAATTGVSVYAGAVSAHALETEKSQRAQAEATASLALQALNRTFDRFAPARLIATAPEISEEGIELPTRLAAPPESIPLLEDLLRTYERIAREAAGYPNLRPQAAEASHRIGDLRQRLGRLDEAAEAYKAALELYPEESAIVRARAYNELGRIFRARQRDAEAVAMHRKAVQALMNVPEGVRNRPERRFELARALYMSESRDALRPPGGGPPTRASDRQAVALLEALIDEFPTVPEYRHLLACCYRDDPRGGSGRALTLLRELVRDFPLVPDYRLELCETLAGGMSGGPPGGGPPGGGPPGGFAAGGPRFQLEGLKEALTLSAELVRQYPNVPEFTSAYVRFLDRQGMVSVRMGEIPVAEKTFRKAHQLQTQLVHRYPDIPSYRFWLCLVERSLGECLLLTGRWGEATDLFLLALERAEQLETVDKMPGASRLLGMTKDQLGQAAWMGGQLELALLAWDYLAPFAGPGPWWPGGVGGPGGPGGPGGFRGGYGGPGGRGLDSGAARAPGGRAGRPR